MRTLSKQEGLPARCRQCGVVYQQWTARFKHLCPACTRLKWRSIPVYLHIEAQRFLRKRVREGKVTMQQISAYLQAYLWKYLENLK